jgi:hypothetical protein
VIGGIIGSPVRRPGLAASPFPRPVHAAARSSTKRVNTIVSLVILSGVIIPGADVYFYVANAKLTAGRLSIIILLIPAFIKLLQKGRRALLCDLFVFAMGCWIVIAALSTSGKSAAGSAVAESIEFCGGYLVARALIFGPGALTVFIRVLKTVASIVIILAMLEMISGRLIVHDLAQSLFHLRVVDPQERTVMGVTVLRAMATFDHAILFGAFCSVVAAITLYSEPNVIRRALLFSFFSFGTLLSIATIALMASLIALASYIYDKLLMRYWWRWAVLWTAIVAVLLTLFLVANKPVGWLISHFTMNPQTGYFRIFTWETAFMEIAKSPLTGYAFQPFGNVLDATIDCVWLVLALRFGLPTIALLFLANVAASMPAMRSSNYRTDTLYVNKMCTAFSLVLFLFMFIGLTVHFWNYIWIFWGVCLGIRASLREESIGIAKRLASFPYKRPIRPRAAF